MEEVNVGIHPSGGGGTEGATGHSFGGFGGAGVVDGVLLEVVGEVTVAVEDLFEFGVGGVAGDTPTAAPGRTETEAAVVAGELMNATVTRPRSPCAAREGTP